MNRRQFIYTTGLSAFALSAQLCPKNDKGEPVKPSQLVVLARTAAAIPIGLDIVNEILLIRSRYGFDTELARTLIQADDKVLSRVDNARDKFASGAWDHETVRGYLRTAADEFKKAVADGTLSIKNAQTRAEWIAWTTMVSAAIESAYELAEALKPLPPTIQGHEGQKPPETITPTEISEIVAISIPASIKVIGIYRQTDAKALWAKGKTESEACHMNNVRRLAELNGTPTLLPKKPAKKEE